MEKQIASDAENSEKSFEVLEIVNSIEIRGISLSQQRKNKKFRII